MINFSCPTCRAAMSVPEALAGMNGNCPKCNQQVQVPAPAAKLVVPVILQPAAQMPPGTRLGLILILLLSLAGVGVGLLWFRNQAGGKHVIENPTGEDALAAHAWWIKKRSPADISRLVYQVSTLSDRTRRGRPQNRGQLWCLVISNGTVTETPGGDDPLIGTTSAVLGARDGGDDVIIFMPGRVDLDRAGSRALLRDMLDQALASRTQREKTGEGNNLLDQMLPNEFFPSGGRGKPLGAGVIGDQGVNMPINEQFKDK